MSNDPDYIQHVESNLRLRETEDLLAIWRAQDRQEWTAVALSVVRKILLERLGAAEFERLTQPPEPEPVEDETEPDIYHDPDALITLASWAKQLSVFLVIGWFLAVLGNYLEIYIDWRSQQIFSGNFDFFGHLFGDI